MPPVQSYAILDPHSTGPGGPLTRNRTLRWGVYEADRRAFERARAVLRTGGILSGVCGGPEESRVPARRMGSLPEVLATSDILIVGGDDPIQKARTALEAGLHVSAFAPMTLRSRALLRAAHTSRTQKRLLHLFDPMLYRPAFRTLRGHTRSAEITGISANVATEDPIASGLELLERHIDVLHTMIVVGGPVENITRVTHDATSLHADIVFRKGARASLDLAVGAPCRTIEFESDLNWTLEGMHLFCGSSMTTLTDNRTPEELAVLELEMLVGGKQRPSLTVEAHYHTLVVIEALTAGRTGRLG